MLGLFCFVFEIKLDSGRREKRRGFPSFPALLTSCLAEIPRNAATIKYRFLFNQVSLLRRVFSFGKENGQHTVVKRRFFDPGEIRGSDSCNGCCFSCRVGGARYMELLWCPTRAQRSWNHAGVFSGNQQNSRVTGCVCSLCFGGFFLVHTRPKESTQRFDFPSKRGVL